MSSRSIHTRKRYRLFQRIRTSLCLSFRIDRTSTILIVVVICWREGKLYQGGNVYFLSIGKLPFLFICISKGGRDSQFSPLFLPARMHVALYNKYTYPPSLPLEKEFPTFQGTASFARKLLSRACP